MGIEDNQINWRTVFCKDPTKMLVTTYPFASAEHTVVQPTASKLKCTTTPDLIVPQQVVQSTARNLLCTATPDQVVPQMVTQSGEVKGIWPTPNAERIHKSEFQDGVGIKEIYTVPDGYILFITSTVVTARESADVDTQARMGVRDEGDGWNKWLQYIYFKVAGVVTIPMYYFPALEALEFYDVFIESTHANVIARGTFSGWLEAA